MRARMASFSPSMKMTWDGRSLSDAQGCGGERVGLFPDFPRQKDAEDADQDEDERPSQSVLVEEIGEEGYFLDLGFFDPDGL
jgi:hypothetical protein